MQNNDITTSVQFQNLVFASVFATLMGFLLVVCKSLLLPIFVAVISVYVLTAASDWLGKHPIVGFLPDWARRLLVLLAFIIAIVALTGVIIATAGQLIEEIPNYQKNLRLLATAMLEAFGRQAPADWNVIWQNTVGEINLQSLAT